MNPTSLSARQASHVLGGVGVSGPIGIELVHERNHVWRLVGEAGSFFLKTYTKSWYAAHGDSHAFPVAHEAGAWRCLEAHGLLTPEVVAEETGTSNPLGRPYLLTRELAGKALGTVLRQGHAAGPPLGAVGDYLRRMHTIEFAFPGYVSSVQGPTSPRQTGKWQHRCWTVESRQNHARDTLEAEAAKLSEDVRARLDRAIATMPDRLGSCFEPPRFVHGDCHANSFFLVEDGDNWQVTGPLDLEVASAGDAGEDLAKLCVELAALLPACDHWWEALFDGYGATPEFDLIKLRLLGAEPSEFAWIDGWPGCWNDVVQRILNARSWKQLFDLG